MPQHDASDPATERPTPKRLISIGAGTVVMHDDRVLLVRNIYGPTKGRYLLPAVRETFEETNLRVEIEGLLGVRLWVMDEGEHNYFFMFRARLLSPISELRPNLAEIDDARFFSRAEMDALGVDETWAGAIAIAYKGLNAQASLWPNHYDLSNNSGVDRADRWRIWL